MAKVVKGACELKSGNFQLMRLALYQQDWNTVQAWVADQLHQAPEFFAQAPLALDCQKLSPSPSFDDLEDLLHRLRYAGVQPIALVAEADSAEGVFAKRLGLALLAPEKRVAREERANTALNPSVDPPHSPTHLDGQIATPLPAETHPSTLPASSEPSVAPASVRVETKIVRQIETVTVDGVVPPQYYAGPVRSGQQLYAKNRDLIVTGSSAPASEIIADGSVHVYGKLMGKVIAGASGNVEAKIYCLAFGAELVSIAGIFRVFESIPRELAGKPVQIYLIGDKLQIEPFAC